MLIHDHVREVLLPILPKAQEISRRHGLPTDYKAGHRPRYFAGNLGEPSAVRLILLLAEPGSSPGREELNCDEATWLEDVTCDGLGHGGFILKYNHLAKESYEKNPRDFIQMVWPGEAYADRMKKVVITNSFCMQAKKSGGAIPAKAAQEYGVYLKRFIAVFKNAVVVAAGKKASDRCRRANIPAFEMGAFTPPGSNLSKVKDSWVTVADKVRAQLGLI